MAVDYSGDVGIGGRIMLKWTVAR